MTDTLPNNAQEEPATEMTPSVHSTRASSTQATTSESEDDPMSTEAEPAKKPKPTYYARRDEIQMLQAQLGVLTEHMEQLQMAREKAEFEDVDGPLLQNVMLRSGLKQTDLALAGLHSILSNFRSTHGRNPLETYIRLSAEPMQRHVTLQALRNDRLQQGMDFILERVRFTDLSRSHRESESFELPNGDYVILQCEIEPSTTHVDVKQVFDDVLLALLQQEFTVGDTLGVTATVESDGADDRSYSQARVLTTLPDGAQIEKHMMFSSMFSSGTDELNMPYGLVVIHPVAEDERYPFQPHLRVRQDATMVILVCPLPGDTPGGVIVRWAHTLTYKPQCGISRLQEMRIRDMTARWCEVIRNNALEAVLGRNGQP
ncbi:hypothetical protein Poli38472_012352 [Pythium oligandrum]|uniref:Uncharacterized protein n=1 Tax=Pythium oligandrum TaxID=41045 RepID=A0A8K1CP57_PYTOL|nr:hypothetical protein Poli38472_012352 [Pythium oligandrum]|eukprot:TMW67236.1 hypothetical protein Poli38472_012352 [Pythium oligandrum]